MIKWIFFDIGSTLVDESQAYKNRINKTIEGTDIAYDEFWNQLEDSFRSNDSAGFVGVCSKFGAAPADWDCDDEFVYPEAEECLKALCRRFKIGIIANQKAGSKKRLESFGLMKYIDLVIASAEEGASKPDPMIFKIALERADCGAEEAVMVGDRLDNDILPANKLGMTTVWIRQGFGGLAEPRSEDEQPDYIVNGLSELYTLFDI